MTNLIKKSWCAMATFGGRLRRLREEKDLKQTELAKLLNLESSSTISQYENESLNRIPDAHILKRIADIFDCSTDYLLGRTSNRKENLDAIIGTGNEYFTFHKDIPQEALDEIVSYAEYVIKKHEEKKKKGK